jgi:hypothetical protein
VSARGYRGTKMAANSVAFFYWPQIWIGELPFKKWEMLSHPKEGEKIPDEELIKPSILGEEVFRKKLNCGILVKVLRQGSFHFDFTDWEPGKIDNDEMLFEKKLEIYLTRAQVINTYLAVLCTSNDTKNGPYLKKVVISPRELQTTLSLDNEQSRANVDAFTGFLFDLKSNKKDFHLTDWWITQSTIDLGTIEKSFELFDDVLNKVEHKWLVVLDLLDRSYKAYEDLDFNRCLTNCWVIIEQIIDLYWQRFIDSNRHKVFNGIPVEFIDKPRKDRLMNTSAFTASTRMEVLSFTQNIPFNLYKLIDEVRNTRNQWLHRLKPIDHNVAFKAIKTAEALINNVFSVKLSVKLDAHVIFTTVS